MFEWLKPQMTRFWYGAGKWGSMLPILKFLGVEHYPIKIWSTGNIVIYFQFLKGRPPFDDEQKRIELLNRLNTINGVNISIDKISVRPNCPITCLIENSEFEKFIKTIEWFFGEVKNQK